MAYSQPQIVFNRLFLNGIRQMPIHKEEKRLGEIPLSLVLIMAISLAGCTAQESSSATNSTPAHSPNGTGSEADVSAPTQVKTSDTPVPTYTLANDKLGEEDEAVVADFGKAFVNHFTGAVADQQTVSFADYISNDNLLAFVNKMLTLEQKQAAKGASSVNFAKDNTFNEALFAKMDDQHASLHLKFSNQGSGMNCKLLIRAEQKSLQIVDVYFGNKDGVDTLATGHPVVRKLDNPYLWDDAQWVAEVSANLERQETGV